MASRATRAAVRSPARAGPAIPRGRRNWARWYPAALAVVGAVLYWRALGGPFLFDDFDILEPRTSVRMQDWKAVLTGPRPLLILSYVLNYRLAGGRFRPFDFHVVSLALHIANATILWLLFRRLPGLPGVVVWWVPILFLASPVQTESVAYIASRSELLAATFYLLGLLAFAAWSERRPWLTAAAVAACYVCSVTSKQHGLTLPGAVLLMDYLLASGRDWKRVRRHWPTYAVLALLMAAGAVVVVGQVIHAPSAGFSLREVTWRDYLFTQFRIYWLYLRLLLLPFGLNADYDIAPSRTLGEHFSWLGLAGLAALVGGAVWVRRRVPAAAFGTLFYLTALFPTSSFYPLLDYAAERRLYLPSIGFLAAALALAARRWGERRELGAVLAGAVLVYGAGTIARNRVWSDSLALWEDTARKSPRKWRVFANLGREYSDRQRFEEAGAAYRKAVELSPPDNPNRAELLSSLGSTYANRGLYSEAVPIYHEALRAGPGGARLLTNLGIAEVRLGRPEGWRRFEEAIERDPVAWEPHLARGNLYYQAGRYEEAIRDYERVLQILPDHSDALHNLEAARAMSRRQGR